uniref:Wsv401 n=1 Tax=White spot syndrome virus TaxID=92652 RepID=A0A2U9GCU0_WSSV|nr:wsv401 [Shrimp white spot syndrome virus]
MHDVFLSYHLVWSSVLRYISCGGGYTSFHWWERKYYGSILMEDGFLYPHANAMWKILYVSDKGKNMNKLSIHMSYPDI